ASAIDAENLESWCDENGELHIGISPWYSTKDVDQTVLCTTKIIHVVLGMHATDAKINKPKTLSQKIMSSINDIMTIQKDITDK
ncbi:MAG: hypothetical protein H7Z37_00435, partial [Pyrinomonadaceae bacterium]|nr:hypothetical protein [Pyrinomonadaceae bacterium]